MILTRWRSMPMTKRLRESSTNHSAASKYRFETPSKGLLALEGELAPILVQMVKSANTNGLLDNESDELHEFAGE